MPETFLVTGAMGCIGAWALRHLVDRGDKVVSFDLSTRRDRVNLLLTPEEQEAITFLQGDLTDAGQVRDAVESRQITRIIHLAALQVPFCKADPVTGARVNVTGTVNVFEAARHSGIDHLAYASSIAVYGPPERYGTELIPHHAPHDPRTLYGVYKSANEGTARVYWDDWSVSSTALRAYTVYGVGRDQGLTSEPTKALLAVAAKKPYAISFGGAMQFQWASDVAQQFIAAALEDPSGAYAFNFGGPVTTVQEFADIVRTLRPAAELTVADVTLPFPAGFDDEPLRAHASTFHSTPLTDGIGRTLEQFEALIERGQIDVDG